MSEHDRSEELELDPADVAPTDNSTGAPVDLARVVELEEGEDGPE